MCLPFGVLRTRAVVDSELPPDGGGALRPAVAGGVSFAEVGAPLRPPSLCEGGLPTPLAGGSGAVIFCKLFLRFSLEIAGDCVVIIANYSAELWVRS